MADSKASRSKGSLTVPLREELSDALGALSGLLPTEFSRQPRSLTYLKFFKATEFRSFLLYTGVVVLRDVLGAGQYDHFVTLSVAIRLLSETDSAKRGISISLADKLLKMYVRQSRRYYGRKFLVYNVHNLTHIAADVERFGLSLTELSSFPFENYLGTLKRYVRGRRNPLVEIVKRRDEFQSASIDKPRSKRCFKVLPNGRDSVFEVDDGVVFVRRVANKGTYFCDMFKRRVLANFFEKPMPSTSLGIYYLASDSPSTRITVDHSVLHRKLVCVPYRDDGFVLTSLLHDN